MTIRRGESWGVVGPRDHTSPVVRSDAELHDAPCDAAAVIHLEGGDLARALGISSGARTSSAHAATFVVDAYEVTWTSANGTVSRTRCRSHCVHGSWWRGESWWFSAGGFVDGREILPRCHPNDGVAEVLRVDAAMSLRQRYDARRRLRWGTHLPHPDLRVVRGASLDWESHRALPLVIDGTRVGRAVRVNMAVLPDACRVSVTTEID